MKANKEQRFKELVDEFSTMIRRICRYHFSNASEQDDLHQEVLVNIWNSLDRFRGDCQMKTWIYRIAVNTALTFRKQSLKHSDIHLNDHSDRLSNVMDDDTLSVKLLEEHRLQLISEAINTLSIIDKMLITLMLEELSSKEISQIVGITESNVRVKIHRIKEELKVTLKGGAHE